MYFSCPDASLKSVKLVSQVRRGLRTEEGNQISDETDGHSAKGFTPLDSEICARAYLAQHQSIGGRQSVTRRVCQTFVAVTLGQGRTSRIDSAMNGLMTFCSPCGAVNSLDVRTRLRELARGITQPSFPPLAAYSLPTYAPYLQLRPFALELHDLHLEVDDDRREELAAELVGDEPADEARLAHAAVPDD